MQEEPRQRAAAAFQAFLNTPIETWLQQHTTASSEAEVFTQLRPQFQPTKLL